MERKRFSAKERQHVYEKCNGRCAYCGCELDIKDMQIDHIQSLYWHNGSNEIDNLLPACRSCNHYKGSSTLENFRKILNVCHKFLCVIVSHTKLLLVTGWLFRTSRMLFSILKNSRRRKI